MKNRTRPLQVKFYVNDDELKLIDNRVKSVNISSRGAYLRKMAIDRYIVNVDTSDLKAVTKEINAIGKNINQIVHKANTFGITKEDVATLKARLDDIWQLLKSTLSNVLSESQ